MITDAQIIWAITTIMNNNTPFDIFNIQRQRMSLRKKLKKHKQMQKERGRSMNDINNTKQNGEDVENKKLCNVENTNHQIEDENLNISTLTLEDGCKPDFVNVEVIKIEDESDEEIPLNEEENTDLTNQNVLHAYGHNERINLNENENLFGSQKRGIFPDGKIKQLKLSESRNLKCCLIDHCYFQLKKSNFIPLSNQRNIRIVNLRKSDSLTTLPFQNIMESNENRIEQQTVTRTDSISKHVFHNSYLNSSNKTAPRKSQRTISVSKSSRNNSNSEIDNKIINERPLRYSLRSNVRKSSNGNVDNGNEKKSLLEKNDSINQIDGGNRLMSEIDKSDDNKVVSLDDIAKEISEMEKIIQSKCDISCDNNKKEKSIDNVEVKNNQTQSTKLRKIRSKDELTKLIPEDKKNWNLEYTEDDVKNLGLDDLLLKASELNAENFTKALGQNATGRNGNKTDASEIVLSFPTNTRKSSDDIINKDNDSIKSGNNSKKTKLDFLKKYVKEDKSIKISEEETTKIPSPKRLGIKVKTVQNINEELGAKLKNLETIESGIKPLYTIADDITKNELFISGKSSNTRPAILGRKISKPSEINKNHEDGDESRPFIMTIIQNKDNNDRLSKVLNPKISSKSSKSENMIDEKRMKDGENDNVTLMVSEARNSRTFEVVNVDDLMISDRNSYQSKKNSNLNYLVHYRNGSINRKRDIDGKMIQNIEINDTIGKKKNLPLLLNNTKKYIRMTNNEKDDSNKRIICSGNRMKSLMDKGNYEKNSFTVTSIEQKIISKEGGVKYLKVAGSDNGKKMNDTKLEENIDNQSIKKNQLISLATFSNILKDILPDKWILSLDKRYGLQILKTHLDELLNPSIMISVVIGRTGKVTVNVRGRQLEKSHDLFTNLCDVGNSNDKISINYILSIINKLRFFNVCFGCDDLSLKKYWCEDGFIEYYTEFQQTYRSHICESLVRLGKRRCHPCHRMNESLKKRKKRDEINKKELESKLIENHNNNNNDDDEEMMMTSTTQTQTQTQSKSMKKNIEEFIEESFINMRQKITDEIERRKEEEEENEKVPKTQDEVLSFMGLTRKDSLDVNLRKSKRERKGFKKCESMIGNHNVNKEELYFLEKYWNEINALFSTSILIGAYSRTTTSRLREKCRMFYKLLSTWRVIVRDNPDWVGGYMNVAENLLGDDENPTNIDSINEKFDKLEVPALRAYIINCVKEVNKIKSRLRTKNGYFKVLYNTFVKPRMKKVRQSTDSVSEKDSRKEVDDEELPDEESKSGNSALYELDSNDEKEEETRNNNGLPSSVSDGD